jgi:hypothetical protein
MRALHLIAAAVLAYAAPTGAFAWGVEGHAIVADIAEARLTPAAKAQVVSMLSGENHTRLDEISSWADEVRNQKPKTASWHFVDVPFDAPGYDPSRDCADGNCVVRQIIDFTAVLGNNSATPTDRFEALKWVVHFVGDIHQPLHAEDDKDRGGNDVSFPRKGRPWT